MLQDFEFVVRWVREHPQLSDEAAAEGLAIALERHQNPQVADSYAHWMSDALLHRSIDKALERVLIRAPSQGFL